MTAETDLAAMLATLDIERRDGLFVFTAGDHPSLREAALASVDEPEGPTFVVPLDAAERAGVATDFVAAWLTLTVWSSLEAVGLTAAVSTALADAGIACNVLAGYYHDHLLVPADRADEAISLLRDLSARS